MLAFALFDWSDAWLRHWWRLDGDVSACMQERRCAVSTGKHTNTNATLRLCRNELSFVGLGFQVHCNWRRCRFESWNHSQVRSFSRVIQEKTDHLRPLIWPWQTKNINSADVIIFQGTNNRVWGQGVYPPYKCDGQVWLLYCYLKTVILYINGQMKIQIWAMWEFRPSSVYPFLRGF